MPMGSGARMTMRVGSARTISLGENRWTHHNAGLALGNIDQRRIDIDADGRASLGGP